MRFTFFLIATLLVLTSSFLPSSTWVQLPPYNIYLPTLSKAFDPPDPELLVISPNEMDSGYQLITEQRITNEQAAEGFSDPAAALQAFQIQGRLTSYFIDYRNQTTTQFGYLSDEVILYNSVEGATAGLEYLFAEKQNQGFTLLYPDYYVGISERSMVIHKKLPDQLEIREHIVQRGVYIVIVEIQTTPYYFLAERTFYGLSNPCIRKVPHYS